MDHEDSAEARLRALAEHFRTHPAAGRPERRATRTTAPAPLNLTVLSYIQDAVAEVVAHTEAANPDAKKTRPAGLEGVYDWCRENTKYVDETIPLATRTLEIRHHLEHAIAAGDANSVIRPIRCPSCDTLGLLWAGRYARCVNRHCAHRNNGLHRTWTPAQLARREAMYEMTLRECAT